MAEDGASPIHFKADKTSFNAAPCMTTANFCKIFKASKILKLDFRNLHLGDYTKDTWDIEKVFYPTYKYYQHKGRVQGEPEWYAMVRTVAELYCPNLPDHCFVEQNEARKNVTSVFRSLMTTKELWSYTELSKKGFHDWARSNGIIIFGDFPLDLDEAKSLSSEDCLKVVQFTCHPTAVRSPMIAAAIYFITVVSSQGFITHECMKKIETMVNDELGSCVTLNHEVVNRLRRELFRYLQNEIDCVKIAKMIPHLVTTKIGLMLRNINLEGLSHLFRIRRMIKCYPDFPWSQIDQLNRDQTVQLRMAFRAIWPDSRNYYIDRISANPDLYLLFAYAANDLAARTGEDTEIFSDTLYVTAGDKEVLDKCVNKYLEKIHRYDLEEPNYDDFVKRLIEIIPF